MDPTPHTLQNAGLQDPRGRGVTWIAMLALSCVLHAESVVECAVRFPVNVLPHPWLIQFAGVAMVSFLLGLAGFFVDRRAVRIGLFSVRAFAIALFIAPFSEYNATKLALLYAFFLEAGFELDPPASIVLSVLASFFMVGLAQSGLHAHPPALLENPIDFVFQYLLDAVLFVVGLLIRVQERRHSLMADKAKRLEDSIRRLTDANTGFQQYIRIAEENSKTDERNRIIRELHDSLGYTFTTIIMLSESGIERGQRGGFEALPNLFQTIRDNAKNGLTDIRIALRLLKARRDRTSDLNALLRLTKAFEKATNVRVSCSLGNAPFWFGSSVDSIVFRIIQEGMVNAFRHGNATEIDISLWVSENRFLVSLRDNGKGSSEIVEGIGVTSMREELAAIGGSITFDASSSGFALSASVPMGSLQKVEEGAESRP
jgi:signal transduction histidine kinase